MAETSDTLEVLIRVPTEVEANIIVGSLNDYGITATSVGEFTCGFRAEAPGEVSVLVKSGDLEHAKSALATIQQEHSEECITDDQADEACHQSLAQHHTSAWKLLSRSILIVDVTSIPILLIGYIVTLDPSFLAYTFMTVAILGLVLYLSRR